MSVAAWHDKSNELNSKGGDDETRRGVVSLVMAVHSLHPDSHTHGLADGCPRCAEHAAHPFESLDGHNIRALSERVIAGLPPRSENEAIAMRAVGHVLCQAQGLGTS